MSIHADKLYELLPPAYRLRDDEQGGVLKALLAVMAEQGANIENNLDQLYLDQFIETCADWVIPYIGDLLECRLLHDPGNPAFGPRAWMRARVANTIRYRRRKGTAAMLEQLARDTTGWNACAVEFFRLLCTTQNLNHLRPENFRSPDLRRGGTLDLLDSPFDRIAHTADVRHIATGRGKHNIPNVGLFLWRLQAYPVSGASACDHGNGCFSFSPLGHDMPLFNRPRTEEDISHVAGEENVPGILRRRLLYDELEAWRQAMADGKGKSDLRKGSHYFGAEPVFRISVPDLSGTPTPIEFEEMIAGDLSSGPPPVWPPDPQYTPSKGGPPISFPIRAAVDPVLGRIAFPAGQIPTEVLVSSACGFSSDIGGGPYSRPDADQGNAIAVSPRANRTIADALTEWQAQTGVDTLDTIRIEDSRTYRETLSITLDSRELTIRAKDGHRPVILGDLKVKGGNGTSRLTLDGLLIGGAISIEGSMDELKVIHCTLVPGRRLDASGDSLQPGEPSIEAKAAVRARSIMIDHSITGPLRLPEELDGVSIADSIVDSPERLCLNAIVSGDLSSFPELASAAPELAIRINEVGPFRALLERKPAGLGDARDLLEAALRKAHACLDAARVLAAGNRLIILTNRTVNLAIENADEDATASELRLDSASARREAFVSGALSPFPVMTKTHPALRVTMGALRPLRITLEAKPDTLEEARDRLQSALRNAGPSPAFKEAVVTILCDRLVVLPGAENLEISFGAVANDTNTVVEMKLLSSWPALSADELGGKPGPAATIERSTIFGAVHVREMALVSDSLLTGPATSKRKQHGCVRFSYLPADSETPRRYRCQPDLALAKRAREMGKETADDLTDREETLVKTRVQPSFTSSRYGTPAYAQLSVCCPEEIRTGAGNGSEIGAFCSLLQPQREANLKASLDEYLRLGLEAGIFYVT